MKIIVLVKQVPDKDAILRINREGTWIEESDLRTRPMNQTPTRWKRLCGSKRNTAAK